MFDECNMDFNFTETNNWKKCLIYENYIYRFEKGKSGDVGKIPAKLSLDKTSEVNLAQMIL